MVTQQQINALAARKLAAKTKMSDSDAEALAYVKSLAGFREAYPDKAAEYEAAKEEYRASRAELRQLEADYAFEQSVGGTGGEGEEAVVGDD